MVRAVEPHINRRRSGSQDTGQAGATHHHIGCLMAAQQVEDRIHGPAVVAELDGDTHPFRKPAQEVVEPVVITFLIGRQLNQQQSASLPQLLPTIHQPRSPWLGPIQTPAVAEAAGCLHAHPESWRQPISPTSEPLLLRPSVETRVQLYCVELLCIPAQPIPGCQRGPIQDGVPVLVTPSGRTNPDVTHSSPIAAFYPPSHAGGGLPTSTSSSLPIDRRLPRAASRGPTAGSCSGTPAAHAQHRRRRSTRRSCGGK